MNIFNWNKNKKQTNEIAAFEEIINSAFTQMKINGVEKLPLAARVISDDERKQAEKDNPELFGGWVDTRAKTYYPVQAYSQIEQEPVINNQSYIIINLTTGALSKEWITSPFSVEEITGDMKEGFEISSRYFICVEDLIGNHNQKYITINAFCDNNKDNVRKFAKLLEKSDITPESLKEGIASEIKWYKDHTIKFCEEEGVHNSINKLGERSESHFKPYIETINLGK